jgi:integrase
MATARRADREPVKIVEVVERFGMAACARALLYRLAVETGLRAGELRSLTRASFTLEGADQSVTIAAAYAKNRREDTLPLKPETAAVLAKHVADKMPQTQAFTIPPRQHVAKMFRADLAAVRKAWIAAAPTAQERIQREQSTRMMYRDDAGLVADFHSLRHSCGSWLLNAGVDMRIVQRIMRHSTITLTVDRYGKLRGMMGSQSQKQAVERLPDRYRTCRRLTGRSRKQPGPMAR